MDLIYVNGIDIVSEDEKAYLENLNEVSRVMNKVSVGNHKKAMKIILEIIKRTCFHFL